MGKNRHPVVKEYKRLAPIYDHIYRHYISRTLRVALEMMQLQGTERILDVACGTGELERRIVRRFPEQRIRAIDLSDEMLRSAKRKLANYPNVQFERADSRYLPFPDARFDIVISCSAFHYMRQPQRVVSEFARVVKPDGRVIILDWCRDFFWAKAYNLLRKVFVPAHHHVYRLGELYDFMRQAGLAPTQHRMFKVLPVWRMMCVEAQKVATSQSPSVNQRQ